MSGEAKIRLFIYIRSAECLSQVQGVLPALGEPSSLAEDEWTDDTHRHATNSHQWGSATRMQVLESTWALHGVRYHACHSVK